MRQIIIDAIKEEIDASIDATDLSSLKIDAEERRRLNNEVNYKGKSYRNQNINDLLIDYSSKDLNEEQILALLENKVFQQKLVTNGAYYIVRPIFKYLLESEDSSIVNRAVALYFEKYKKCFKTINFESSARLGYEPRLGVLEYLANLENMNKGLDDKFIKKVDYDDIYRLGGYTFTPRFYQRAYGTIEREYMQSGCRDLKSFTPLIDEYTFSDVSKSNFVYAYKALIKELNKDQSMQTKEEIELILETINTLGKLNREDEKEAISTNAETLQRLLIRCDKVGLELSDKAVNKLAYEILNKDKRYQELKRTIQQLYLVYIKSHYDSNVQDFVDMINSQYNYDFSCLFGGKSDKKLTVEMLESFVRDNHVFFIKQLGPHLSTQKYVEAQEFGIDAGLSLNANESSIKREILIKYQDRLRVLKSLRNKTIEYYVFMNIPEEDRDAFMNLFHYWCKTDELDEKQFSSPEAKKGVFDDVCEELKAELTIAEFATIDEIAEKHKQWLIKFNSYRSQEKLKKFKAIVDEARAKLADKEATKHLSLIVNALKNNANIYLLFEEHNIPIEVFEIILKNEKSKYANMKKDIEKIISRYQDDKEAHRSAKMKEKREQEKQDKYASCAAILTAFIEGSTTSIKEYIEENGIHPKAFEEAVNIVREKNLELYDEYIKKLVSQSKQRFVPVLENAKNICKMIIEGVEEEDDVRAFDYLDFKLATRMSLEEFLDFVKKQKLLKTQQEIRAVAQFKSKNTPVIQTITTNQQIYDERNIINGREIELPIKKAIVAYLKAYGISHDYRAYKLALNRFLNHKLDIKEFYEEPFDEDSFFDTPKSK